MIFGRRFWAGSIILEPLEDLGAGKRRGSVLECASPMALFHRGLAMLRQQRAAALQDLAEFSSGLSERGHSFN
jgi:hypothetical protein